MINIVSFLAIDLEIKMQSDQEIQNRRLTEREILERYQISHTTLWRWERNGKFPKGKYLGQTLNDGLYQTYLSGKKE